MHCSNAGQMQHERRRKHPDMLGEQDQFLSIQLPARSTGLPASAAKLLVGRRKLSLAVMTCMLLSGVASDAGAATKPSDGDALNAALSALAVLESRWGEHDWSFRLDQQWEESAGGSRQSSGALHTRALVRREPLYRRALINADMEFQDEQAHSRQAESWIFSWLAGPMHFAEISCKATDAPSSVAVSARGSDRERLLSHSEMLGGPAFGHSPMLMGMSLRELIIVSQQHSDGVRANFIAEAGRGDVSIQANAGTRKLALICRTRGTPSIVSYDLTYDGVVGSPEAAALTSYQRVSSHPSNLHESFQVVLDGVGARGHYKQAITYPDGSVRTTHDDLEWRPMNPTQPQDVAISGIDRVLAAWKQAEGKHVSRFAADATAHVLKEQWVNQEVVKFVPHADAARLADLVSSTPQQSVSGDRVWWQRHVRFIASTGVACIFTAALTLLIARRIQRARKCKPG